MRRQFAFFKMHGAGNDFVFFDDREAVVPIKDRTWLCHLADRHTGIGCEGFGLLRPSDDADFRLLFLNPDGAEAELCGNATRCAARLATALGIADRCMAIETGVGVVHARVEDSDVTLELPALEGPWSDRKLALAGGGCEEVSAIQVGVPHAVIIVENIAAVDVNRRGATIRRHAAFEPAGTNVDFVSLNPDGSLALRTYERGVEGESGACGTGAVAAAVIAAWKGAVRPPVTVTTTGGYTMQVDFRISGQSTEGISLAGPAAHVFNGTVIHEASSCAQLPLT